MATLRPVVHGDPGIAAISELIDAGSKLIDESVPVHIEALLPAFVLGCIIAYPRRADGSAPTAQDAHVLLGTMFPVFCYRKEAHWRERLALAVGMWPRGEVGAGVLVISLSYGIGGPIVTIAMLSLALNPFLINPGQGFPAPAHRLPNTILSASPTPRSTRRRVSIIRHECSECRGSLLGLGPVQVLRRQRKDGREVLEGSSRSGRC